MTPSMDFSLAELRERLTAQLGQLEARGRLHLGVVQRRHARSRALAWALRSTVVVPTLWACSPGDLIALWPYLALATLLVPLLVVVAVYLAIRHRQRVSREEALSVVDQKFALKDRLTACAALLNAQHLDGFGQAALLEAAPWVTQALTRPLAAPARLAAEGQHRRWLFLPAALLLVALAWWLQMRAFTGHRMAPGGEAALGAASEAVRRIELASAAVTAKPPLPAVVPRSDVAGVSAAPHEAGEQGAQPPSPIAAAVGPGASAPSAASTRSQAGAARPSPSTAATSSAPGAAGMQMPHSISRSVTLGNEPTPPQSVQSAEASPPGGHQDDGGDAGGNAEVRSRGRQEAPSQRGSQPPPGEKSSQSSQNGQPQNDSRSKGGNDSQNDGKGNGEGQNSGSRNGQDAGAKAGRGFATLMLARPMRDQVLGQANPGHVSSVLQQGRPQGGPSNAAVAQDRGQLADNAAVLATRPQTPQERALLRDYFARDGHAPAAGSDTANATKATR